MQITACGAEGAKAATLPPSPLAGEGLGVRGIRSEIAGRFRLEIDRISIDPVIQTLNALDKNLIDKKGSAP
jgi:hypothetical protein